MFGNGVNEREHGTFSSVYTEPEVGQTHSGSVK